MNTSRYDGRQITKWISRRGVPALAWVALVAFVAFTGLVARDESRLKADAAPAVRLVTGGAAAVDITVLDAPSAREPELHDEAVIAHEALDPVGVGLARP